MILDKDQKKQIKENTTKLESMGEQELEAFAQKWHMAKEDLDISVFSWVLKVIDDKQAELKKLDGIDKMAVSSEFKDGDRDYA